VDVDYDGAKQSASFGRSQLRSRIQSLSLNGVLATIELECRLVAKDLHELTTLAAAFSNANPAPPKPRATLRPFRGAAHFTGPDYGTTADPRIKGQLSAANLEVQGSKWATVRVGLDAASSGFRFSKWLSTKRASKAKSVSMAQPACSMVVQTGKPANLAGESLPKLS